MDPKHDLLRHFLAALAYRTQKALRGCQQDFPTYSAGNRTRTPEELVRHMTSVLGYARTFFIGGKYWPEALPTFEDEVGRFHEMLSTLADHLGAGHPFLGEMTEEKMLQGPLSDAMTHAGQLAMLRRLHGDPVPPENFIEAGITFENLSSDQPDPASPDEHWPEAPETK